MPKLAGGGSQTRNMLDAGASGAQAVQGAHSSLMRTYEAGQQNATQQASVFGGLAQQGLELKEQNRANVAREGEETRSNQMREAIAQDSQDIEAADQGLESQGESRADKLRREMEQGRRRDQANKPLEVPGADSRTLSPTAERQAQEGSKLATSRLNAQSNYLNAVRGFREAKLKGSDEAMQKEAKNLQQPIKSAARLFDLGRTGKITESEWSQIKELAGDVPDPALQAEIGSNTFGPRVGQFLQNRVAQSSMQFMAMTGDMPDGELVDMASPAWQQFTAVSAGMQNYLKMADQGGVLSTALGIDSLAKRNQIVRQLSAQAMLKAMADGMSQQGQNPIPSQGGPSNGRPQPGPAGPDAGAAPGDPREAELQQQIGEQQRNDASRRRAAGAGSATGANRFRGPAGKF